MLPTFVVIGATKCATTTLHRYLCDHPDVYMHPRKELRFFTAEHNWGRGEAWYRARFADASGFAAVGEASNAYSRWPVYDGVPARMAALIPGARLVYIVRDPMARLVSHYRHRLVTGIEWRPPSVAVLADDRYVAASLYGQQLRRYLQHYSREQMLILRLEDLAATPGDVATRLCGFLGVDPTVAPAPTTTNATDPRVVAPSALRQLSRVGPLRPWVKRAARRIARSRVVSRRQAGHVDVVFETSVERRLAERFEADAELFTSLTGLRVVGAAPGPGHGSGAPAHSGGSGTAEGRR